MAIERVISLRMRPGRYNPAMNTVVIVLDQCPVGCLGPYGNEWVATPNLDRLAAAGVVFDRHYSDCPNAAAARRAWRTGRHQYPGAESGGSDFFALIQNAGVRTILIDGTRHGCDGEFYAAFAEKFAPRPSPDDATPTAALLRTLTEVAGQLGDGPWLIWFELDRLIAPWDVPQDVFDAYIEDVFDADPDDPASRESTLDMEKVLTADDDIIVIDPNAEEYTEEVEIEDDDESPNVVRESVAPWADPTPGWFDRNDLPSWELLHRSFAAAVTTADAGLGKLFAALTEHGLDNAAWLFTSDRGQALGEHGIVGDFRPWLYQELVHIPLIVRLPDRVGEGRRVWGLTVPADVCATLLELHGIALPAGLDGVSLVPQLRGRETTDREQVESGLETPEAAERAVRTLEWACLLPMRVPEEDDLRVVELYVKPDDRFEANDVAGGHADVVVELGGGGDSQSGSSLRIVRHLRGRGFTSFLAIESKKQIPAPGGGGLEPVMHLSEVLPPLPRFGERAGVRWRKLAPGLSFLKTDRRTPDPLPPKRPLQNWSESRPGAGDLTPPAPSPKRRGGEPSARLLTSLLPISREARSPPLRIGEGAGGVRSPRHGRVPMNFETAFKWWRGVKTKVATNPICHKSGRGMGLSA